MNLRTLKSTINDDGMAESAIGVLYFNATVSPDEPFDPDEVNGVAIRSTNPSVRLLQPYRGNGFPSEEALLAASAEEVGCDAQPTLEYLPLGIVVSFDPEGVRSGGGAVFDAQPPDESEGAISDSESAIGGSGESSDEDTADAAYDAYWNAMTTSAVDELSEGELVFTLQMKDGTELANVYRFSAWNPETQTVLVQETRNVTAAALIKGTWGTS